MDVSSASRRGWCAGDPGVGCGLSGLADQVGRGYGDVIEPHGTRLGLELDWGRLDDVEA